MNLTVIIPVYNTIRRPLPGHDEADNLKRLYYSILSICQAPHPPKIIVPDGSVKKNFERLHALISHFPNVRHVHLEKPSMNLSALWNDGMILSDTDYVLCTGIDFLYSPGYFDKLMKTATPKKMVISEVLMCRPKWIPSEENIVAWDMPEISETPTEDPNYANRNVAGELANGVQCFHKDWFRDGGGYDEKLSMWGAMDNQMVKRAKVYGLEIEWLKGEVFHIWHPAEKDKTTNSRNQFHKNQIHLHKTKGFKVDNKR